MNARIRLLLSWLALLAAPLWAQDDPKFVLTAKFVPAMAAPGATAELLLEVDVEPGWHAYGTKETVNVPVSLDVSAMDLGGLEAVGDAKIPPGQPHATPIGDQFPLDNHFEVRLKVRVPKDASGEAAVSGELGYQICEDGMCEPPTSMPFAASLQIGEPPAAQPAVPELGFKPGLQLEADEKFTVRAHFEPEVARAGEVTTLVLEATVAEGWHAYGTKETTNIPVAFDPTKQDFGGLSVEGDAQIPPGEAFETPVGPQYPLPHEFEVRVVVRVPADAEPGKVETAGVLDYQVCNDDGFCELPTEAEFDATLTIEAGDARAGHLEAGAGGSADEAAPTADDGGVAGSWWGLILLCIGGGLFALAMPCTYPMIPITFSFFMKQAEKRGGSVLPLTIVYGLGIVAMFVFVGVSLSKVIIPFVNHWATNAVIGVFFFFFAFVLFGWVNLNPPQWMNNLAVKAQTSAMGGGKSAGGASFFARLFSLLIVLTSVFFMGATLVITSFTCTAPIVGSLIAKVAVLGEARVAIGMAIFGLTMAIPFMVLSLMPGKVKEMPKSGQWMDTLKVSLGFVELAAAFKFVSMVDFAFGWQVMPRELFLGIWVVIFVLWALFLFGRLRKAGTEVPYLSTGRKLVGGAAVLFAAYFLYGTVGNRLDPLMTSFAPAYSLFEHKSHHELVYDDPDRALELARSEDKLLLYNLTGFN